MGDSGRELFPDKHALSIKKEKEMLPAGLQFDPLGVQTPARAAICEAPFRHAKQAAKAKRKAEWSLHTSASLRQQVEHDLLSAQGKETYRRIPPIQAHLGIPSQDRLSIASGPASGRSMTVVARSGQSHRMTKPWAKILSAEAGQSPKKHSSEAITGVPANILSEPGPSDSRSAGLGKQAAGLSPSNEGASGHFMSPKGKIRRAPGVVPKPAKQHQTTRTKQTSRKTTSSKRPVNMTAPGIARDETDEVPSRAGIQARIHRVRPFPFGMLAEDPTPLQPQTVEDPEEVTEQGGLCQNIYSREVLEEYRRRCAEAKGKAWSSGVIPEVFLDKVLGDDQHQTDILRDHVVDQITHWLSLAPDQKRRHMRKRLKTVVLSDMSHPAYRRFKEYYEPLELRSRERAQQYKKDLLEWTLLGEYTGVWVSQDKAWQRLNDDPMGLGTMRRDKVTELAYTGEDAPEDVQNGLRAKWKMSLELDSTRVQNRLCLINDCANVPGYDNQPNVVWLECEDGRTLQPHLFLFTACSVKAGQEALLDYGPDFHKNMGDDLKRAAVIVVERQQRQGAEAALGEALHEFQAKEQELQGQLLTAQARVRELEQRLEQRAKVLKRQGPKKLNAQMASRATALSEGPRDACPNAQEAVADAALVVNKPVLPACQTTVHHLSAEEEEEEPFSKAKETKVAVCVAGRTEDELVNVIAELGRIIKARESQGQGAVKQQAETPSMLEVKAGGIFRIVDAEGIKIFRDVFTEEVTLEFMADNRIEKVN